MFYDGKKHKYLWIPHEEIYTIINLNPLCKLCAFLYSAPQKLQEHLIQLRGEQSLLQNEIPVLHDIEGYDCVGILIYDDSKNLTYTYNKANHQHCFKEYSCNGTSWQVACGIYVALTIMPFLDLGSYTFSNVPKSLFHIIDKTLENLNFLILTCENRKCN